ncbi:uncharacterized protein LOC135685743 [Rhopilema esculentum]|uniref:uncharacterized protein LOC135685743 n=1 Tax=Rhopilema esculentum TaxID=499914 RepID=UPI0031E16E69
MDIDKAAVGLGLKCLSTVTAGLFAGGALYINLVEHPARMEATDMKTALTCWKPSYTRAASIMSKFALTSAVASASAYFMTKEKSPENVCWLVSGGMLMTILPFTKLFILPLNNELLAVEELKEKGDSWISENLEKWNKVHFCRTVLGVSAFSTMVYLLTKEGN